MRLRHLHKYLQKWQQAGLISEDQSVKIAEYMKIETRRQFLRLIKVLFVIGAFWIVFGLAAMVRLINIDILKTIWQFLNAIFSPLVSLAKLISPVHYREVLWAVGCFVVWALFHTLGLRLRKKSEVTMVQLGLLREEGLRLGVSAFTIGYIMASSGFQVLNYIIYPADIYSAWGKEIIFPFFSLLATIFFSVLAYRLRDQIALLFAIGFLAHTVGLFTAYYFACYVIGVNLPVIQLLVGGLLVFVGLWHVEKIRQREDHYFYLFGRTYQWTGLLFIYLSLWIMSLWGVSYQYQEGYWKEPAASELWATNILFIAGSLGALFYGALNEDRMFFNFGLTFFIIDSYTLFFSRIWATTGSAFGSFLLGVLLIATGYALRHLWLQGKIVKLK